MFIVGHIIEHGSKKMYRAIDVSDNLTPTYVYTRLCAEIVHQCYITTTTLIQTVQTHIQQQHTHCKIRFY